MNLTSILNEMKLIEAKSISKKAGFKYFFIQEIEDGDAILNTEDLADKSSISILLCTEKNFQKEKITKKDAYSVKTSDLFKYMEKTIPDFKKDDYVDFTGGYSLSALVGNYIEDEFELTWCRSYSDLQRVVDIDYEDNRIDEYSRKRIDESGNYDSQSYKSYVYDDRETWIKNNRAGFESDALSDRSETQSDIDSYSNIPNNHPSKFLGETPALLYFDYIESKFPNVPVYELFGTANLRPTGTDMIMDSDAYTKKYHGWGDGTFKYWKFRDAVIFKTV